MSAPKFTPGPWSVVNQYVVSKYTMDAIARVHGRGPGSLDEIYANARLISAAPDLYAALVALLIHPGRDDLSDDVLIQCDAAIAKVLGES